MDNDSKFGWIKPLIELVKEVSQMNIKSKSVATFIVLIGLTAFLFGLSSVLAHVPDIIEATSGTLAN